MLITSGLSMTKKSKIYWFLTLFVLIAFTAIRVYHRLTDDFRLSHITYEQIPIKPEWSTPQPDFFDREELKRNLSQPFVYIGKGAQSYVFGSEDQKYVIKFFKFKHLRPHWIIENLPSISPINHFKYAYIKSKEAKILNVFESYHTAFNLDKDNTALIYLHLIPTHDLNQKVQLVDKIGRLHLVDLDGHLFMIQQKGEPLRQRIKRLLEEKKVDAAKQSFSQILGMYLTEYRRGLYDRDHSVMQNTGFVNDRPFRLDAGKLTLDERLKEVNRYKKDLLLVIWRIDRWINSHFPHYQPEFYDYLSNEYHRLTSDQLDIVNINRENYKHMRKQQVLN